MTPAALKATLLSSALEVYAGRDKEFEGFDFHGSRRWSCCR